jgi:hypothetical protein
MNEDTPAHQLPQELQTFAMRNPETTIEWRAGNWIVTKPWGDDTIALRIPDADTDLMTALSQIRLLPRFSALWHCDTRDIEIIWTSSPPDDEVTSRCFDFEYQDMVYHCEFGPTSDRFLALTSVARPTRPPSITVHRNIPPFALYHHMLKEHPEEVRQMSPRCFWIRAVQLPETALVPLARHLNLYMRYFDRETPIILVHEEPLREGPVQQVRFPQGPFPGRITARELDDNLLSLWESAALTRDAFRRFLYKA